MDARLLSVFIDDASIHVTPDHSRNPDPAFSLIPHGTRSPTPVFFREGFRRRGDVGGEAWLAIGWGPQRDALARRLLSIDSFLADWRLGAAFQQNKRH